MYNNHYFQPPVFDSFTKWHLLLSFIGYIALFFPTQMDYEYRLIYCLAMVNIGGFIYEYGEATGYGSKEGIDPLDLLMNFIGSFFGMIFIRIVYGV